MHSIRTRITVITIVAILTSILCVFTASYFIVQTQTDEDSVRMMNLIGQESQKTLEKYFENIAQSVEIAANIAIDDLDSVLLVECGAVAADGERAEQTPEQKKALNEYLRTHCKKIQEYFSGVADYTHGVTGYFYCISPEISRETPGFYYTKIGKTGFIEQNPIDVEQLESSETLRDTWYQAAVKKGRPVWIGPYRENLESEWTCSYFVPIYKAGMLIGLMGMDIPCNTLIAQINTIQVYQTGFVCLVNGDNQVIYHPDLPIGSSLDELKLSIHSSMLDNRDSGDELIRYTADGEERQMSFCTLSNGMRLITVAPSREINAPWSRLVVAILMITAGVIAFFVILVWLLMRVITRPLKDLTDASRRLADADYDVDLTYQGNNEIGTLTSTFTTMRDQLRRYIRDLNHQLHHDRMTDLPNMRHFFDLAEEMRNSCRAEGREPVMLYFDIIGMRYYNRQYGFENGDRLILRFAEILRNRFGDHRVCRYSGDRFVAVTEEERAEEEIGAVLRECETAQDGQRLLIRVGVYPNRLESVDVNVACDRAKFACDQNRGELASGVSWFNEEMLKSGEVYRHIINNLDRALAEGWVQVYYQPIIRTANGKICDEEALARWIDPKLGFLSPADFIPALEESKLIYKLDLYVVEQVLEKMKRQAAAGFYLVPQSINLSRMDFEMCDAVEEIRKRVDDAGFPRSMISVEITESVIGSDFEFMKEQVRRFRELGFPVWMDDFGSGYSSLDVLQQIHFDLIKFDMRFMEKFSEGDESKIILTQLMNMAIGLGTETICEGVEQAEQAEFLREIGCTRIQGYYYGKPIPFEEILSKFEQGSPLEFENPEESDYYASIGRINLYDMGILSGEQEDSLNRQYFNTLPMCILEVSGTTVRYNRCNRSYRDFLENTLELTYPSEGLDCANRQSRYGAAFFKAVLECAREGSRMIIDERIRENISAHVMVWRVSVNPVTGTSAVAAAVLTVNREDDRNGTNYSQMAKALAADYVNLYYVDLETEAFIEYSQDAELEDLAMERHGENFFAASRRDAKTHLYPDDQETFIRAFTKENVTRALDSEGTFRITYRLVMDGKPTYVEMKAVRMTGNRQRILVAVSNVDVQMRQKEAMDRIQTEKTVYSRINALNQGYLCIYTVDPETGRYTEYRASTDYAGLGLATEGEDFFEQSRKDSVKHVYPDDQGKIQTMLTKENVLEEIRKNGLFSIQYRLMLEGEPRYIILKAVITEEQDGKKLIIGVNDIDAQVRHEQEFERKLSFARNKAQLDTLTGVKTRTAYESMSEYLNQQIEDGQVVRYAIVLSRVNNLARVNETQGWEAGDQLIRSVCDLICEIFKHSPVFRVAGDQFAVLAQGHDYEVIEALMRELAETAGRQELDISSGMAKYDGQESVASVFARAEKLSNR